MNPLLQDILQTTVEKCINTYYRVRNFQLSDPKATQPCRVIAHRGNASPGLLENSIEAFQACLDSNVWGIEFDIRWSKDNIAVVHHDKDTSRLFSTNKQISEMNFAEIRSNFPLIPSLEEVISLFGKKLHLMIEIKDPNLVTQDQLHALKDLLSPLDCEKDYHFLTLAPDILETWDFPSRCKVGIFVLNRKEISDFVLKKKWKALTGPYFLVRNQDILTHQNRNQIVGTGFIANESILNHEVERGVQWFYTNDAANIQKILHKN